MNERGNDRTASGNGSKAGGNGGSHGIRRQTDYDVPIPRPLTPLGFRGIRRKRPEYDSMARRRLDN